MNPRALTALLLYLVSINVTEALSPRRYSIRHVKPHKGHNGQHKLQKALRQEAVGLRTAAAQERVANLTQSLFKKAHIYDIVNKSDWSPPTKPGSWATCYRPREDSLLTVLTLVYNLDPRFMDGVRNNRLRWAQRHGYEYCEYSHDLVHPMDASWSKITTIRVLLELGRPAVAWIDADALIMNFHKTFKFAVPDFYTNESVDVVLSDGHDRTHQALNTGVMLVKNAPWSKGFLRAVWEDYKLENPWDPNAILAYRDSHVGDFIAHVRIVPHRTMNSYYRPGFLEYKTGDFILHVAGGNNGWIGCNTKWTCMKSMIEMGNISSCCAALE